MNTFDLVAIGDITTDAFIRLKDASVNCDINHQACQLCMRFGDKLPYEFVEVIPAVGNSANAAVAGSRLGLNTALLAHIGDDQNGKDSLERLEQELVSTDLIRKHSGMKSNYHYVLWYEDERTILVKHEEYPYDMPHELPAPKWIYLSSLGASAEHLHTEISAYLMLHPETKLAFQPGTFQLKMGWEKLKALYERTEIFFCNKEEALGITGTVEKDNMQKLLASLHHMGPKSVVITDGPKGAYLYEDGESFFIPPYPDPKAPYERTGAGDAFASTIIAGKILNMSLTEAARWGAINSMSVVQQIGAQKGLLNQKEITAWLEKAPAEFSIQKL